MGKLSKEEMWRREGMAYAYKVAKEKGVEGLAEEIKFRNICTLPLAITTKAIKEANEQIALNTLDTVTILACITLRDEFDFGKQRVQRFLDRFEAKAGCLADEYCTWDDNREVLKEELGLDLQVRWAQTVPHNKE